MAGPAGLAPRLGTFPPAAPDGNVPQEASWLVLVLRSGPLLLTLRYCSFVTDADVFLLASLSVTVTFPEPRMTAHT